MDIVNLDRSEGAEYKDIQPDLIRQYFETHNISTAILTFNSNAEKLEQEELYRLWHLLYSYEGDNSVSGIDHLLHKLCKRYGFNLEQAKILANITLQNDYGNLSTKAMRSILPYMHAGKQYDEACAYADYKFSKQSLTREEIDDKTLKDQLDILPKNSLRNPVVEKILNQMINVVNSVICTYGKPDEIRIEMARELKQTAEQRKRTTDSINAETRKQEEYRRILQSEFGLQHVSRNDIIRYKLYLELEANKYRTLYSNTYIPREKLFSKEFDIEHIIPQARLFDDSFANKTLEARNINIEKSNQTARDYVCNKYGETGLAEYIERVNDLAQNGTISEKKKKHLLLSEQRLLENEKSGCLNTFINRDLSDSAYIAKKARELLLQIVPEVHTTIGAVTARLRQDWQLVNVLQELNWNKYAAINQIESFTDHDGRTIRRITNWTKRNDHRHHAMDALTIAFTRPEFVAYLSNQNAQSDKSEDIYAIKHKFMQRNEHGKLLFLPPMPLEQFRAEALRHLDAILISIKAKNKVVTKNINKTKAKNSIRTTEQLTPRGQLHNETIYGSQLQYVTKLEKVGSAFDAAKIATVANKAEREMLLARLQQFDNNPKKAFTGKNALDMRVKTVTTETIYTIRKPIDKKLKIDKVIDTHIRQILQDRLTAYNGDTLKAFANLDQNPIYLNKEKNITIKRVTINAGIKNPEALHEKKDHNGKHLLDASGKPLLTDFVDPQNNHHVAIFQNEEGNWFEHIVSFYEATQRITQGLPAIDTAYNAHLGWHFLFTMKQNEYFVFPNPSTGFNPQDTDLRDPDNYARISPNLYRVQSLSGKDYWFRHHLETRVDDDSKEHCNITWKRIRSVQNLAGIVKVRINHLGEIVEVGEY